MSAVRSADGSIIGWTTIGDGLPILLVHGAALDRRAWNGGRRRLADRFTVHTMDRRGLYESPMPTPAHRLARAGLLDRLHDQAAVGDREAVLSTFLLEVVQLAPDTVAAMRRTKAWSALLANAPLISRELECMQRTDVLDRLGKVTVAVRLLVGTLSAGYLRSAAETIVAALPEADLVGLPGQGHTANETAPEQLAAAIRDFAG